MIDGSARPADMRLLEAFLNTVDERSFRRHGTAHTAKEDLASPAALSAWLSDHGLLSQDARSSEADLAEAVRLRTTLRKVLLAEPIENQSAAVLAGIPLYLVPGPAGALQLSAIGAPRLAPIIEAVAAAVVRGVWARLKICAACDCRWVFYDDSRSGAGRWCSMAVCGNRAKTRLYRQRQRTS
ncbi:CGNR zinc finger domain-containing protein [Micromonospora chokoriensis]